VSYPKSKPPNVAMRVSKTTCGFKRDIESLKTAGRLNAKSRRSLLFRHKCKETDVVVAQRQGGGKVSAAFYDDVVFGGRISR